MTLYLKDWYQNLKQTNELDELNLTTNVNDNVTSEQRSTNDDQKRSADQNISKTSELEDVEIKEDGEEEERNRQTVSLVLFSSSLSSLIVICAFLFGLLVKFLTYNDTLSGLVFLQSCFITTTCCLLYYPSFRLNREGLVNLRLLKWILTLITTTTFLHMIRNHPKIFSSLILASLTGVKLFRELPILFPKTFTFNELLILSSILSSRFFTFFFNVLKPPEQTLEEVYVVEHSLVWLVLLLFFVKKLQFAQKSIILFISCGIWLLFFYFVPTIYLTFQQNPFVWLYDYLFFNGQKRIYLFSYWMLLFGLMITLIVAQRYVCYSKSMQQVKTEFQKHVLTKIRKIFHMLIMVVFALGFIYDRNLLFLCSYGMLILLTIGEMIRYYKIGIVGRIIQDSMVIFLDEKDQNSTLILSHIHLLIGLSYPLWLSGLKEFNPAELSGLITVGIGDSFASLVGSKYGRHRYPGSKKSFEGTLALIISQLIVYLGLNYYGVINLFLGSNFLIVLVSLFASAFVEAFSSDNDNLVLPLVVYPLLYLIVY